MLTCRLSRNPVSGLTVFSLNPDNAAKNKKATDGGLSNYRMTRMVLTRDLTSLSLSNMAIRMGPLIIHAPGAFAGGQVSVTPRGQY
ncbi:hypothetical protein D8666_18785 [Ochrobactrum soli]|nr:hypothetical protein D8666_18785 [[Ochrobactrum] soli]